MVPSRGIEPRLQDPESCVLSVERRGQYTDSSMRQYLLASKNPTNRVFLGAQGRTRTGTPYAGRGF